MLLGSSQPVEPTLEQHNVGEENVGEENVSSHLVWGPWVAFEKKAESIDRQESIHELSSKVYTATVDSGKSG